MKIATLFFAPITALICLSTACFAPLPAKAQVICDDLAYLPYDTAEWGFVQPTDKSDNYSSTTEYGGFTIYYNIYRLKDAVNADTDHNYYLLSQRCILSLDLEHNKPVYKRFGGVKKTWLNTSISFEVQANKYAASQEVVDVSSEWTAEQLPTLHATEDGNFSAVYEYPAYAQAPVSTSWLWKVLAAGPLIGSLWAVFSTDSIELAPNFADFTNTAVEIGQCIVRVPKEEKLFHIELTCTCTQLYAEFDFVNSHKIVSTCASSGELFIQNN